MNPSERHPHSGNGASPNVRRNPTVGPAGRASVHQPVEFRSSESSSSSSPYVRSPSDLSNHSTSNELIFKSTQHIHYRSLRIKRFFDHSELCDVTLICGGRRIRAHRIILSAASDYFNAMFTSNLNEAHQEEIEIQGVDPNALSALVSYCYSGELELDETKVESLLTTASILQLNEVVTGCSNFLSSQFHPSNCLGIRGFADRQGCPHLRQLAHDYATEYFMAVVSQHEYCLLGAEDLFDFLNSDDLNVPTESAVYDALLKWLNYDLPHRRPFVAKLLSAVRLPLLSPEYIADHIESNPVLQTEGCKEIILEAMKYHLLPDRRSIMNSLRTKPRKSTVGKLYAVGGMDSNKGATTIEEFSFLKDEWKVAGHMSGRRLQFGLAVGDGKLLVCGGRDGLKTLNTFESWDAVEGVWNSMPPMNTPRHGLGVAVFEGPLYAVGGHDGWSYLSTAERFDPITRAWSFIAEMSTPRSTCGVAVLCGRLYAIGGRDGSQCLRTCESYNPHTNKWSACTSMSKRRGGVGVGVLNGFIYAVGGLDAPSCNPSSTRFACVERYDPKTDQWTTVANLCVGRDAIGVSPLGNYLFAVGGYSGNKYVSHVEFYDPDINEWKRSADLLSGRAGSCACVIQPDSRASLLWTGTFSISDQQPPHNQL